MRLLLVFAAFVLLTLITFALWGQRWEQDWLGGGGIDWLSAWGEGAWLAGIGLLIVDLLLPVPATVVMSALGYLYGPWLGGLAAACGSFLAGMAGYGFGRAIGAERVRHLVGDRDLRRGTRLFSEWGGAVVALSRALPILPEAIACAAGLLRMPLRKYVLALVCGSVPMGLVFAWIGHSGHRQPALALALSVVVPVLLWLVARRWTNPREGEDGSRTKKIPAASEEARGDSENASSADRHR